MEKKLSTLSFIVILAFALTLQMIPPAFAEHDATIVWVYTGTDTLTRPEFPDPLWPWLNFTVENEGDSTNAIVRFKFLIPKTAEGYAKFKYWESVIRVQGWSATPDEFDNDGWATVIIFETETNPIEPGVKAQFDVKFDDSRERVCSHTFMIYTIDNGSPPETKPHELYLIVDPDLPNLNMVHPTSADDTIDAIFDPYPVEWYMWIEFTADDYETGEHDTGISRVEVWMDDEPIPPDPEHPDSGPFELPGDGNYYEPPVKKAIPPYIVFKEKLWNLPEGSHTIKVVVWDGARNSKTFTHKFYFEVPTYFKITPDEGTVGRHDNKRDKFTGEWSGSISDVYRAKQLGTEVTVEGLEPPSPLVGFTPNSRVNVYVYHPLYAGKLLVRKNVPTNSRGVFKTTFLFPKAPQGVYRVEAVDRNGITDFTYFTVVPEIIYKPEIVTGPAVVEAIASGLTRYGDVDRFMADGTDALLTVDKHTLDWYCDGWGVLWTDMAHKLGFLLPLLENGMYDIALLIVDGSYWDGITGTWDMPDLEVGNKVHVANDFAALLDAMDKLEMKMSDIEPMVESIDGNVVQIKTEVGKIEAKLDDIKPVIESIEDNVVQIKTEVGNIEVKLDDIKPVIESIDGNVVDIHTTVGNIKGTVTSIEGDVATVETDVGVVKLRADDILEKTDDIIEDLPPAAPDVALSMNLAAVLSAIAAIASITAVAVVLRRLRVAA